VNLNQWYASARADIAAKLGAVLLDQEMN